MENQFIKPASVVRVEFITELTNLINNSMLPAFVIEPILKDMYLETKAAVQKQYEIDKKRYEESMSQMEEINNVDN